MIMNLWVLVMCMKMVHVHGDGVLAFPLQIGEYNCNSDTGTPRGRSGVRQRFFVYHTSTTVLILVTCVGLDFMPNVGLVHDCVCLVGSGIRQKGSILNSMIHSRTNEQASRILGPLLPKVHSAQ